MRYEIIEIYEEDYGCEGIPEGEELMCTVLIRDENGLDKHIRLADSFLTENQLKKGSTLLLEEV
ncbi:hypothetical protein [Ruminococcus flavefaciens]|uniref:hypothetical protein n=1 Tax=Ruminococcus flavefaciens TaxID=1265 RepID=UPI00046565C7|nr:hypothetical protein [Ruminococcus flavefaciens]